MARTKITASLSLAPATLAEIDRRCRGPGDRSAVVDTIVARYVELCTAYPEQPPTFLARARGALAGLGAYRPTVTTFASLTGAEGLPDADTLALLDAAELETVVPVKVAS